MNKHFSIKQFVGIGIAAVVLVSTPVSVSAIEMTTGPRTPESTTKPDETTERLKQSREQRQEKRDEGRAKKCEERKERITKTLTTITSNRQRILERFTSIAEKAQAFAVKKNRSSANYEQLATDVAAKKAVAQTSIDNLKAKAVFTCDVDQPRTQVQSFRTALKETRVALKAYRDSIKALIHDIKATKPTKSDAVKPQTDGGNQ